MVSTDKGLSASVSHAGAQEKGQVFVLLLHMHSMDSARSATATPKQQIARSAAGKDALLHAQPASPLLLLSSLGTHLLLFNIYRASNIWASGPNALCSLLDVAASGKS